LENNNNSENDIKKTRIQISAQAWITTLAVMGIDKTLLNDADISLKKYICGQKENDTIWLKNSSFTVYNYGYLLMMAYAFLVIPKETIEEYGWKISSLEMDCILKKITITVNNEQNNLSQSENIIRHIRNSISHADFSIIPDKEKITLIDKYKNTVTFCGEIKIDDFKDLISLYFKEYYNTYMNEFVP